MKLFSEYSEKTGFNSMTAARMDEDFKGLLHPFTGGVNSMPMVHPDYPEDIMESAIKLALAKCEKTQNSKIIGFVIGCCYLEVARMCPNELKGIKRWTDGPTFNGIHPSYKDGIHIPMNA